MSNQTQQKLKQEIEQYLNSRYEGLGEERLKRFWSIHEYLNRLEDIQVDTPIPTPISLLKLKVTPIFGIPKNSHYNLSDNKIVELGGKNRNGKTSIFKSILFAIYGTKMKLDGSAFKLEDIVHQGQTTAEVSLTFRHDVEVYTIRRTITSKGSKFTTSYSLYAHSDDNLDFSVDHSGRSDMFDVTEKIQIDTLFPSCQEFCWATYFSPYTLFELWNQNDEARLKVFSDYMFGEVFEPFVQKAEKYRKESLAPKVWTEKAYKQKKQDFAALTDKYLNYVANSQTIQNQHQNLLLEVAKTEQEKCKYDWLYEYQTLRTSLAARPEISASETSFLNTLSQIQSANQSLNKSIKMLTDFGKQLRADSYLKENFEVFKLEDELRIMLQTLEQQYQTDKRRMEILSQQLQESKIYTERMELQNRLNVLLQNNNATHDEIYSLSQKGHEAHDLWQKAVEAYNTYKLEVYQDYEQTLTTYENTKAQLTSQDKAREGLELIDWYIDVMGVNGYRKWAMVSKLQQINAQIQGDSSLFSNIGVEFGLDFTTKGLDYYITDLKTNVKSSSLKFSGLERTLILFAVINLIPNYKQHTFNLLFFDEVFSGVANYENSIFNTLLENLSNQKHIINVKH